MKILIERFGPIEKFEYDLDKKLIVTYGNNNIGKSYAMQIVYLLMKTFISVRYMLSGTQQNKYIYQRMNDISIAGDKIELLITEFMNSENQKKEITGEIVFEASNLLSSIIMPEFMNSCKNTFGNFDVILSKNPKIIIEQEDDIKLAIDLKRSTINGNINLYAVYLKKATSDLTKSQVNSTYVDIFISDNVATPASLICEEIYDICNKYVRTVSDNYDNVYFLPASRSGIYAGMNAFGSIVAELSKNRSYFTKKIEFPGISEPISDYFLALSNIGTRANDSLADYYSEIEEKILKGEVTFDKNRNALIYTPKKIDDSFEMTEVSSMVSEISPIVAFLKYILTTRRDRIKNSKSILFIEEPEAHLHPNNQIALVEIFSKLINENIELIMSSHSNYVFNKLNNLVLSGELDYRFYEPIVLKEDETGSISKYVIVDELGADDENFVDVSQQLYDEREEIMDKLNMGE